LLFGLLSIDNTLK